MGKEKGMKKKLMVALAVLVLLLPKGVLAAIGCTLSNPAQDLKELFPEMTSYKEEAQEFGKIKDGDKLFKDLKERLGSDLDQVYETYDTPYTVYKIFKGNDLIGIVHGVNVPGKGGVIQVFLSMEPKSDAGNSGEIKKFFFQRLESPASKALKNKDFRAQFTGLTLADFYKHDYYAAVDPKSEKDKLAKIKEPEVGDQGKPDYLATIRGIRKNLILLDMFVYEMKFEPYYKRSKESIEKAKAGDKPTDDGKGEKK
jgi:hypothetical protein